MIAEKVCENNVFQNENQEFRCAIHKGSSYSFIEVYNKQIAQTAVCCKCVTKHMLKGENLLCIDDLLQCESKTVFLNWPIVDKRSILQEYQNIIENIDEEMHPSIVIDQFFSQMELKVVQKIIECKKKILSDIDELFMTRDQLNYQYNNISQKNQMKQHVVDLQKGINTLDEIDHLIKNNKANSLKNQELLQNNLDLYNRSQRILQLEEPKIYLEQILLFIDQIFINLTNGNDTIQLKSTINQKISQNKNIVNKMISLIDNPTNHCNQEFISQLQKQFAMSAPFFSQIDFNDAHLTGKQPLNFRKVKENQFKNIEIQLDILQKINQVNICNDDNNNQISSKFKLLESHLIEFQKQINDILKCEQDNINEIKKRNNVIINKTSNCEFIKSTVDECSQNYQTIQRIEDVLEIHNSRSGLFIQSFYDKVIQPDKKYVFRILLEPFSSFQRNYEISIGIIQSNKINSNFLNSSSLCFTNKEQNYFNLVKKGKAFNDAQCRHDSKMRILEFQMCLEDKHFQISDYPNYENITVASEENLRLLDLTKQYMFGIEYNSVEKIKITFLSEVLAFIES